MDNDELPAIDPYVDYTEISAIHQKRIIAFINHFLLKNVSFLNNFAQSCESRLMDFEYKVQKIEASLLILEAKLSSIPFVNENNSSFVSDSKISNAESIDNNVTKNETSDDKTDTSNVETSVQSETSISIPSAPVASVDSRYIRFFKMLQFGVPMPAVKQKMSQEGIDPNILDRPNDVIPGYRLESETDNTSDSS